MTEMKKNKKMMLIALLALLVVASAAFIGTLARYVTSNEVSESADVAKFGLNIPNSINLFSDSYTNVKADVDGKKIIAPGTSGFYDFEVTGTSEVAYKVSADISLTYSEEWDDYDPLVFSVNGNTWTEFDLFKENLSSALASEIMAPNATYSTEQRIYWKWPFHVSTENDVKDTEMGLAAAEGTAPNVKVDILVTAAQIE